MRNVSRLKGPILVHVVTQKGKGYRPAEENPALFHGVGPFDRETGVVAAEKGGGLSYTAAFGQTLCDLAKDDERVVAITAAMLEGTGLKAFAETFPGRFFDVGIAEQHAVTFAAGLACKGMRPTVAIYSTFLQRAYDNLLHDVCLQNLPVAFAIDRAGLVGADGPTHHGTFDLSYLRQLPNLIVMAPRNLAELRRGMLTALEHPGPFAYRYPRGTGQPGATEAPLTPLPIGKGETLRNGSDGTILAVGSAVDEALQAVEILARSGLSFAVVDARFVKPLDRELILLEGARTGLLVTVEENVLAGGFGAAVLELLAEEQVQLPVLRVGLPDRFVEQGSQQQLRARLGIDAAGIAAQVAAFVKAQRQQHRDVAAHA